jgi:hypothetical protein
MLSVVSTLVVRSQSDLIALLRTASTPRPGIDAHPSPTLYPRGIDLAIMPSAPLSIGPRNGESEARRSPDGAGYYKDGEPPVFLEEPIPTFRIAFTYGEWLTLAWPMVGEQSPSGDRHYQFTD